MSSQINPNSVNQSYPVAGVDNNSQGFRDNFAAIKNNFIVTRREMDDLMNKAVVKSALTYGPNPSGTNNNFDGEQIANAVFAGCSTATTDLGTKTTGNTVTVNYSLGNYHIVTLAGSGAQSSTLAFSNWSESGNYAEAKLRVTVTNTGHTLTLPAAVSVFTGTLSNYALTSRVISFPTAGVHEYVFATADNGTTVSVTENSKPQSQTAVLSSNALITSNSFVVVGNSTVGQLSFTAAANQRYKFEALLPVVSSASATDTHSLAMNFSAGTCYYVVEQQASPDSAFTANAATTSNSSVSTVTTTNSSPKFARISGTFTHTADTVVSVSSKTSANTFTVIAGASLTATPLNY